MAGAAPSGTPRPITYDFFFSRPAFRRADACRWRFLEPVVSSAAAAGAAPSGTPRPITYDFFSFPRPAFRRADGLSWRLELWFQVLQRLARRRLGRRAPSRLNSSSSLGQPLRGQTRAADAWNLWFSSAAVAGAAPPGRRAPPSFQPLGGQTGSTGAWNCGFKCCSRWRGAVWDAAPHHV